MTKIAESCKKTFYFTKQSERYVNKILEVGTVPKYKKLLNLQLKWLLLINKSEGCNFFTVLNVKNDFRQ